MASAWGAFQRWPERLRRDVLVLQRVVKRDRLELLVREVGTWATRRQRVQRPAGRLARPPFLNDLLATPFLLGFGDERHHHAVRPHVHPRLVRIIGNCAVQGSKCRPDRSRPLRLQHTTTFRFHQFVTNLTNGFLATADQLPGTRGIHSLHNLLDRDFDLFSNDRH